MKTNPEATMLSTSQPERCPICDWPMADDQSKGCVPGDCSYRPDDPAEQERIRKRRAAFAATPAVSRQRYRDRIGSGEPEHILDSDDIAVPSSGTQGALALYLNEVQPVGGRVQLINISLDELSVLRRLVAAAVGGEVRDIGNYVQHHQDCDVFDKLKRTCTCGLSEALAQPATPAVGGEREALSEAELVKTEIARANEQDADISASEVDFMATLAAPPASQPAAGGDALLLMQARYVLLNLNAERPGCGYDKLADACEAAGLSEALVQPAEKET